MGAGQEKYGGDLRNAYMKGSDMAIIIYDVTNRDTIKNVKKWLTDLKQVCEKIPVAVLGNKIDKVSEINSLDQVKMRDSKLKTIYNTASIKNFLVSVKSDTKFKEAGFLSRAKIDNNGITTPIEYLLTSYFGETIKIVNEDNP